MKKSADLWDEYQKTGDPDVRERIILENVPLVRHILGQLAIPRLSREAYSDLLSQGILGLIDAVDRFEPCRGWRFSTYATLRIRGTMLDSLRARDMLPRGARKRVKGIEKAIGRLRMELCREPSDAEVAAAMEIDVSTYRAALVEANCAVYSIDAAAASDGNEQDLSFRELLWDPDAPDPEHMMEETELLQRLTVAFEALPERLQILLSLYYYENLTMKEIGQILELSESRVSQLHARAVRRLRDTLEPETAPVQPSTFAPPTGAPLPVFAAA
jgi:RNA polymerase sigma factor for flagellar operon FliA